MHTCICTHTGRHTHMHKHTQCHTAILTVTSPIICLYLQLNSGEPHRLIIVLFPLFHILNNHYYTNIIHILYTYATHFIFHYSAIKISGLWLYTLWWTWDPRWTWSKTVLVWILFLPFLSCDDFEPTISLTSFCTSASHACLLLILWKLYKKMETKW